ncbi:hypothetical protein [Algoriphagus halophilus]|uniref:Uncharacterized protein n=1 Tax=Algoriphagus halophilus TaxID=226505 RepID=A0A1N6DE46_9BACT|nr:hypothetical protein [Algoriphagus halophilus]SIN69006.1 hypothetical protein SAMN05444394_0767 [Algoriphagus halophilus]
MNEPDQHPDLELWKDQQLLKKLHRLKLQFWDIFSQVAETIADEDLRAISLKHKSKKLSRGNDLLGMPYHVLDIIRNFDPETGLNIRVLNWFGNGLFLIILAGEKNYQKISSFLYENNFYFGTTESPWDYPGLILENQKIKSQHPEMIEPGSLNVWIKEIEVEGNNHEITTKIAEEIQLIVNYLSTI